MILLSSLYILFSQHWFLSLLLVSKNNKFIFKLKTQKRSLVLNFFNRRFFLFNLDLIIDAFRKLTSMKELKLWVELSGVLIFHWYWCLLVCHVVIFLEHLFLKLFSYFPAFFWLLFRSIISKLLSLTLVLDIENSGCSIGGWQAVNSL